MPTEKTRTVHVRRIKDPDNEEVWIDVERVDKLISSEGQGPGYKKTTRKMFWADEGNDAAHPTRTLTEKRIENPEDDEMFVNLNVIDRATTQRGQGPGYLKSTKKYVNDKDENQTREFTVRRVYHWDTNGDPNDTGGVDYQRTEGTKDETQYIDVAVIDKLISRQGQGPGYKKRTFKFNTDPIKEFSEPAPDDADLSKVVHLDPWQNIVNVKWNPPIEFVTLGIAVGSQFSIGPPSVFAGGSLCSPSTGYTPNENSSDSTVQFGITDDGAGPPEIVGKYVDGELMAGGSADISGLDYPFPFVVDIPAWEFAAFNNTPSFRYGFEEATGEVIVDRKGNPVLAFDGFDDTPYRRATEVNFKTHGVAFTSGPACWQLFGGPGGDIPRLIAFVESHGPNENPTEIPYGAQTISISSITVVYEDITFTGAGYWAGDGFLSIICERAPES